MAETSATLKELLLRHLDHPWLRAMNTKWPVSLVIEGDDATKKTQIGGNGWECSGIETVHTGGDFSSWQVELHCPSLPVQVALNVRLDHGSAAVMLSGEIRNTGSIALRHVRAPQILDVAWKAEVAPEPFIRRISGGPWGETAYPPVGYRCEDVQLLRHRQQWKPIAAACPMEDGRASVQHQPLMVIGDDRTSGILIALEWAGTFLMECRRQKEFWGHDLDGDLTTKAGINGIDLTLAAGAALPLPTAWIVFYRGTLNDGGQVWRRHFRDRLAPRLNGAPVIPLTSYDSWIGYEIVNFNEAFALAEAEICAQVGLEYFCFDAGWCKSGGDWEEPDLEKIPSGFESMAKRITDMGLKFGCWLDPESAKSQSKLAREHPEWFIQNDPSDMTNFSGNWENVNLFMNFGLREVRDWWLEFFDYWCKKCHIRWIRWDHNQLPGNAWQFNDHPDGKGLTQMNHIRGVYETLDQIIQAHPDLVLELTCGGGNRVEPGIMRRCHTYWIDDQSTSPDLVRFFQHGMNHFWPAHYANVSVCSRHGELSKSDWLSHQAGSFGVSTRLTEWMPERLQDLANQITRFKTFRRHLERDFASPTGQPQRLQGKHELCFGDHGCAVKITHNLTSGAATLLSERTAP